MKKALFVLSAAALISAACDELQMQGDSCTVTATAEKAVKVTKVSLNTNTGAFEWQGGDTLAVCTSKSGKGRFVPFAIVGGGRSNTADFRGEVDESAIKDCAIFPYIHGYEPFFQDGDLYVNYPVSTQYWEKSSRGPMFASVSGYDQTGVLAFTQLGGVLNVKIAPVPQGTAKIVLMAGKRVAGAFKVDRSGDCPFVSAEPLGEDISGSELILTFAKLVAEQEQMYCQFAVPVGDYSYIRFQARGPAGKVLATFRTTSEVSVGRGDVINLVPSDDIMPGFSGSSTIGVSAAGAQNATLKLSLKNNDAYHWVLSLVSFSGCVTAASVTGETLTYSVGPNDSDTQDRTGEIVLKLSDPDGKEAPVTNTFTVQQSSKGAKYYVKVTSEPSSWEGKYLMVYETESEGMAMCTGADYSDTNCPGFLLPLEDRGICQSAQTDAGEFIIKKHAPDANGAVNKTAIEGKYTFFLSEGLGFGRYALDSFGFNNNNAYGRFVITLSYDAAGKHPVVTSRTKSSGEAYLKYDSSNFTFGFGLPSEISDTGRFVDIQLYRLED